jgi:hypothetical protein
MTGEAFPQGVVTKKVSRNTCILLLGPILLHMILSYLLCSLEFPPQMTGGVFPPGLVTEKESMRHSVAVVTIVPLVPGGKSWPKTAVPTDAVLEEGPPMVKRSKSRRSWKQNDL